MTAADNRPETAAIAHPATWHIEVVADSDSRWKWGAAVASRLAGEHPAELHATLLLGRSEPTEKQMSDVGVQPASLRRASLAETIERLTTTEADVVVLACIGGCVQCLLQALSRAWRGRTRRPVVVTGYVGLVYERIVDGLIARAGADLVLANCDADAAAFTSVYADLGADPSAIVGTALPFLGGEPYDPQAAGRDRPYTLTFVTQPGVPESERERRHLLAHGLEYAQRYPQREVIFKLRALPHERTTHVEPYHFTTLLADGVTPPANFSFVYGAMSPVLDRTDLCVTVSSTAAIEAMHRGIPTAVLTDYGIRELVGNPLFLGSGTMTSWPALLRDEVPVTSPRWAAAHGVHGGDEAYAHAAARLDELVALGADLPPLRPWLDVDKTGEYLSQLLRRYGLDPDAQPLVGVPRNTPPLAKRAARKAARKLYRYGVDVLEPRIKRMAQL